MSSDTTSGWLSTLRTRLLAYTNDGAQTITTYVGSGASARVFMGTAPDDVAAPYIVIRNGDAVSDPQFGNIRQEVAAEVTIYGRGRGAKEVEAELIADLVEEAVITWQESSTTDGVTYGQRTERTTEPPMPEPPDRDLITIRIVAHCIVWGKRHANALT